MEQQKINDAYSKWAHENNSGTLTGRDFDLFKAGVKLMEEQLSFAMDSWHKENEMVKKLEGEIDKLMGEKMAAIDLIKLDGEITAGLTERLQFLLSKYEAQKAENVKLRKALEKLYNSIDSCIELTPAVLNQAKEALTNK